MARHAAGTGTAPSIIQSVAFADESWRHIPCNLANFGIGRWVTDPRHGSHYASALWCTCRDIYLWYKVELPLPLEPDVLHHADTHVASTPPTPSPPVWVPMGADGKTEKDD